MILLMDRQRTEKTKELRERILQQGIPCAASFSPFSPIHLPNAHCVLTTEAGYTTVRAYLDSEQYSSLPLYVVSEEAPDMAYLTDGSARGKMVGKKKPLMDALLTHMTEHRFVVPELPDIYMKNGFVITSMQIYWQIYCLQLNESEKRVLQFFLFHPDTVYPSTHIAACALDDKDNLIRVRESVTAAISGINRKMEAILEKRMIFYVRNGKEGGYIFQDRNTCE